MITEEAYAREERRLGETVHFHDGVWWIKAAPFYYKPAHEFRPFQPNSAKPHPLKALMGFSHQAPDSTSANRHVIWNVIQGDDLKWFSLDRLKPAKRRAIRKGQKACVVAPCMPSEDNLERMRLINISQAQRFVSAGEDGTFLPASYYELHASEWHVNILKQFSHKCHQFMGAFVENKLAAYVDLIRIEDTWKFGAVKSDTEYLQHRPVDALYFNILSLASQNSDCNRVVNGGGLGERTNLTRFKGEFFLKPMSVPYYSRTLLPLDGLRKLKSLIMRHRWCRKSLEERSESI